MIVGNDPTTRWNGTREPATTGEHTGHGEEPDPAIAKLLEETDLQHQLLQLGLNERVDFDIGMNGELPPNRFWRVSARGDIDISLMTYLNSPVAEVPRPNQPHWPTLQSISVHDIPLPTFKYSGTERQLGHIYNYTWSALVSAEVLDCMLKLDPDALEYREATTHDLPVNRKYYFTMIARAIDPIDPARMRGWIENKPVYFGSPHFARAAHFRDFSVRSDIPQTVHLFTNVFGGYAFWSDEMLACANSKGVTGIEAHRAERRALSSVQYL